MRVRPFATGDAAFVRSLAPRLAIGIPAWRDARRMTQTAKGWIADSISGRGGRTVVFVAEDDDGRLLGFASVSRGRHFTGEPQVTIGELATSEKAQGRGAGRLLVQACERWANEQGYRFLSLTTGAANRHARGFYRHLGYLEEDVTLVKRLARATEPD